MTARTGRGGPVRWAVLQRLEAGAASIPDLLRERWGSRKGLYLAVRRLVELGCVRPGARRGRATVWEVVPALLLALLAGCATTGEPDAAVAGRYRLVAWHGAELPTVVIADTVGTTAVTSGTLVLDPGGTFSESIVQVVRYAPAVALRLGVDSLQLGQARRGQWRVERGAIVFRLADRTGWTAEIRADGIRYAVAGQRWQWGRP